MNQVLLITLVVLSLVVVVFLRRLPRSGTRRKLPERASSFPDWWRKGLMR